MRRIESPALSLLRVSKCFRESRRKGIQKRFGAARHPDAAILGGNKGHSDKNPLLDERFQDGLGKASFLAAIDCDKIGCGGQGHEATALRDFANAEARGSHLHLHFHQPILIFQGRQRTCLADPAKAEMIAHLIKIADQGGWANSIADAGACKPIPLGEGAHCAQAWRG